MTKTQSELETDKELASAIEKESDKSLALEILKEEKKFEEKEEKIKEKEENIKEQQEKSEKNDDEKKEDNSTFTFKFFVINCVLISIVGGIGYVYYKRRQGPKYSPFHNQNDGLDAWIRYICVYMHVCMYVCIYIYIYTYVCMYVCIYE